MADSAGYAKSLVFSVIDRECQMNRFDLPTRLFYTNEECLFPFLQQLGSEGSSHALDEKKCRFRFNSERVRVEDHLATISDFINQDFFKFYQDQLTLSNANIGDEQKHTETTSFDEESLQEPSGESTTIINEPEALLMAWQDGQAGNEQIMQWLVNDPQVQLQNRHLALTVFLELLQRLEPSVLEPKKVAIPNFNNHRIYLGQLTVHYPIICQELTKSLSFMVTLTQAIAHWHNKAQLPGVLPMKWVRPTADGSAYELIEDRQSELLQTYSTTSGMFHHPIVLDETYLTKSKRGILESRKIIMEQSNLEPHDLRDVLHQLACVFEQQLGLTAVLDKMSIVYEYDQGNKKNVSPYCEQKTLMLDRIRELKKLIQTIKNNDGAGSIDQAVESLKALTQQAQILRQLFILIDPYKGILDNEPPRQLKERVNRGMNAWLALPTEDVRQEVLSHVSLGYLNNQTSQRILMLAKKNPDHPAALVRLVDAECQKGGSTQQIASRIHERVHGAWWDLSRKKDIDRKLDEITGAVEKIADFESTVLVSHIASPDDLSQSFMPAWMINAFGINNRYQRWQVVRVLADLVRKGFLTYQEFKTGLSFIQFQLQELYTPHFALSESSAHLLTTVTAFLEANQVPQEDSAEQASVNCSGRLFNLFNQAKSLRDFSIMRDESQWKRFCKTLVSPTAEINFDNDTCAVKLEAESSQVLEIAGQ